MRKARGWTQRHVAEKAGMSLSYYTEIELGRKQINARRLESLAKVFGVEPHELIVQEGQRQYSELADLTSQMNDDQQRLVLELARSIVQGRGKSK